MNLKRCTTMRTMRKATNNRSRKTSMRYLLLFLMIFLAFPLMGATLLQADLVTFENVQFFYAYGDSATLQAEFSSKQPIQSIALYIHPDKQYTRVIEIEAFDQNQILQEIAPENLTDYPFTRVYYWFEVSFQDGKSYTSSSYWFDYLDNRFEWKHKRFDKVEIYWQNQDDQFAQDVYNTTKLGLQKITEILDASLPEDFKIIIYPDASSLQSALNLQDQLWVAGHANPSLGMVILSIPPGPNQKLELERQLPHELMHLMEYQIAGPSYTQQPVWLKEGLASIVELYPNPDYQRIIQKAAQEQTIKPMVSYCNQFPADASGAFLAYAQSWSFLKYINEQYGSNAIQQLFLNYRDGLGCEEGFLQTYNKTIYEVEKEWKRTILNMDVSLFSEFNLSPQQVSSSVSIFSPYLLLSAVLILPPFFSGLWLRQKRKNEFKILN